MENQARKTAIDAVLRRKYGWIVAEAYALLEIIFEKGLAKDQQVALMAQVLADRGIFELSEPAFPMPFTAITSDQATAIDRPHYKGTAAFVKEITQGNKPVGEVAANVIAFLEGFPSHEERVVVFARMLKQGLTPYVSIPEGLLEPKNEAANSRVEQALTDEKLLRAELLIDRIFQEKDISNARAALACTKVLADFADQPDLATALLFRISEYLKMEESALDVSLIEIRGLPSFLSGLGGVSIRNLIEEHARTCTNPACPVKQLHP